MQRRTFIYTFALESGGLLLHGFKTNAMKPNGDHTLIRIIYNNIGECEGLTNGWGLSVWIEKIAPSHCTGNSAIKTFRHEWGANFVDLNIGDTFEV